MRNITTLRSRLDNIAARQTRGDDTLREIREMIDAAILRNGNVFRDGLIRTLNEEDENIGVQELAQVIREFIDGWEHTMPPGEKR